MTDEKELCAHCGESIEEQVAGLKKVAVAEREERKETERKLKQAKEKLAGAGDVEDLRKQIDALTVERDEALGKFGEMKTELDTTKGELATKNEQILDGKIGTAVAQANGNLALLRPAIRDALREKPDADVGELVASMKQDENFQSAFRATTHSSGGAPSETGGGRGSTAGGGPSWKGKRRSQMTDREAVDAQKELGLDAYMDLPA